MPASFFDSNVLVYIASADPAKADRAEKLVAAGGAISVQVLNEVANVTRRKMGMGWNETHEFLSLIRRLLDIADVTVTTHDTGLALAERHRLSIYDAMIAASALLAGCDTLWSEDMQHGLVIDRKLRVANPFREIA